MTMAEDKWNHLKEILLSTDNRDPLPTNRPLHIYLFYHHKLTNIRNKLWKNTKLTQWGKLENYFERNEFQNRGTIYTHGFSYTSIKIPELIERNTIWADLPGQNQEPELYHLVTTYQIHRALENDDDDEEKPYWDDAIDKYFSRPKTDEFRSITYPKYFKNYNLKITLPLQSARQS
ncbi:16942_t:CDS:2, partial [Gigaspora rosea]